MILSEDKEKHDHSEANGIKAIVLIGQASTKRMNFRFLTDRFVRSETVLVKFFADAKSEMKEIPSRPQAFHTPQAYFTCEANITNPGRDLFR